MNRSNKTLVPSFDPLQFRIDDAGQADFDAGFFLQHRPALTAHLPAGSDTPYMELIICWYVMHRAQGGAGNPCLDQTLRTAETEHQCVHDAASPPSPGFSLNGAGLTA